MLQQVDDNDLVARALRGDREAFGRLVERHYDGVYRIARRILGSSADAEDVAQEVAIKLATRLDRFGGRSRFRTWVTAIAINECRDLLRRRKASAELMERYVAVRDMAEEDAADDRRRAAWLDEALAKLEPGLRETAVLVAGEDMTHAEAAAALGCAESTVSWRMHMARKRLRAIMDEDDGRA